MTARIEPALLDHLRDVLRSLITLLTRHGRLDKVEWLVQRLAVLDTDDPDAVVEAVRELHRVVLGMGGLMDMHLRGVSGEPDRAANAELRRLADQLFDLTE